jgi:hypothetical protein
MPSNQDIESLSQMLLDDLYNWNEESFSLDEEDMEIIDKRLEMIGIEDGYYRPSMTKQRIEPRDGILLRQDGKKVLRNEEKEIIIEIKRRKLATKKKMKEKEFEEILKGKKRSKKVKKEPAPKMVKQRVLKREFEDQMFMKRKIDNVISGKLDPPKPPKDPLLEPDTPPEMEKKEVIHSIDQVH